MSVWTKISDYINDNITKNVKQLLATFGSMILTLFTTILFVVKEGFSLQSAIIVILLEMQPFFYIYIKIIFEGQSNLKDQEIVILQQTLSQMQELTEYKIKLASRDAIIAANAEWNQLNQKIAELDKTHLL